MKLKSSLRRIDTPAGGIRAILMRPAETDGPVPGILWIHGGGYVTGIAAMAYSNMRKNHQYLLAYGMKKLGGGSWAEARRACGITDNYRLRPDKRQTRSRMQMTQLELF